MPLKPPESSTESGEVKHDRRFTMEITMKMKENCGLGLTRKFSTPSVKYYNLTVEKRRLVEHTVCEALLGLGLEPPATATR